jgi:O-acetyl-ADP-ribose deacetylase (regulator of RNase III)
MFKYTTGNILESSTDGLINTVNCEGYMGKGIAYQFKINFPENNQDYIKACKNHEIQIGKIHIFKEKNKTIINFPTKNKWRENSKYEYIELGMKDLVNSISLLNLNSISIPPLGCGNGGLEWIKVKEIIINYLKPISNELDFLIYEPSTYYSSKAKNPPKINTSHIILMIMKLLLNKFTKLRLQKTAYFLNIISNSDYFKFSKHKFGPYAHSIDILSREIKEYQDSYNLNTDKAIELAKKTLLSDSVEKKLNFYDSIIEKSVLLVNSIKSNEMLELVATVCFLVKEHNPISFEGIKQEINNWSFEKSLKFTESDINKALDILINNNIIALNMFGYEMIKNERSTSSNSRYISAP